MRSISSASPPAVGNTMTGWPKWPHRATVTSLSTRFEYQRSRLFMAAQSRASVQTGASPRIYQACLAGEEPAEAIEQAVAPVDPVVAVQRLDHAELVGHVAEHLGHRPIRVGQWFEHPIGHENPIDDPFRACAHLVHKPNHRFERGAVDMRPRFAAEAKRWGFEEQRAVKARRTHGGGKRCHPTEARAHQHPAARITAKLEPP